MRLALRFILVPLAIALGFVAGVVLIQLGLILSLQFSLPDTQATLWLNFPQAAAEDFLDQLQALVTQALAALLPLIRLWQVALMGMLVAEAFSIRSFFFHIANFALSAALVVQWIAPAGTVNSAQTPGASLLLAAALVGGLIYFGIAGRGAGFNRSRESRALEARPPT